VLILWVAHLQNSRYELGQHIGIARETGLSEQQINAIIDAGDIGVPGAVVAAFPPERVSHRRCQQVGPPGRDKREPKLQPHAMIDDHPPATGGLVRPAKV
jgi:hypothetical protein